MPSILMVLTGATRWSLKDGTQRPTGFWAEEFVEPHSILRAAGARITLVTPGGRRPVPDELSLRSEMNGGDPARVDEMRSYLDEVADALDAPGRLEEADAAGFDGVVIPGGHGPMQDLAVNEEVGALLAAVLPDFTKVVGALCHGPAAFMPAGTEEGWLFRGRAMTSFTDEEERQTGLAGNAPWLLESRLRAAGARFVAGAPWSSHVVVDGNLVTGQNPGSAREAAQAIVKEIGVRT
ncbi:type 1 glutamine amidotransferase domain-containing protein [Streptomyces sp. TS71-3]|uniref:type 1 glutamine amidotransferase domain-containing protein n=1 Tax=Streptomyces sp. TS71-3 TaxID=2733862 RepID=UPI001B15BE1E|nr:type 1 glutamine amidotransferase domain-containing protein [Streptomyces sp. TS71-3]GHJ39055.1 dimethylallyltransferase [Streptomyces sp. TS71-3]